MSMDYSPVWISLKVTLAATGCSFLLGILAARWRMEYRGSFGWLVDGAIVLPLALPPTVVGLILLLIFGNSSPIGIFFSSWSLLFTWRAAALASFVVSFPLMYLTTRAAFQQIDPILIDTARIEGLSGWKILWRAFVPLAWNGIAAGTTLAFVRGLGEFGATLMIAGNIPGITQTMPLAIYSSVEAGEPSAAVIFSLVNVLISVCALLLVSFFEKKRA
ncbi:MAG: molybdate ABC transporter permease subunit [Bacteroidota bacterium]|nr:molybdate ABC transporter permease subunit [Bacteroidota bacterium]